MKESALQTRVMRQLRARGALVFNVHGHGMQEPGWPDLYVAHVRWQGWVELKVEGRKLGTAQRIIIRRLVERGVNVSVVRDDCLVDIVEFLDARRVTVNELRAN